MTDTVTVTRVTGPPGPVDPDTGEREPAPTTTVYTGPGKVQTYEPHESARKSGEHIYIEQRLPAPADQRDRGRRGRQRYRHLLGDRCAASWPGIPGLRRARENVGDRPPSPPR